MIALVTGGAASGKSELAERIAVSLSTGQRLYIATMQPLDEESKRRVERHRRLRSGKGFDTAECYGGLCNLPGGYSTALLECMSNLVANCTFGDERFSTEQIARQVIHLAAQYENLIVVTNEVFSDGMQYQGETADYLRSLGWINQWIGQAADLVVEAVCGIPVVYKGELPWC